MLKDRSVLTLLLGSLFVLLGALARPASTNRGMPESSFWARKMLWSGQYDVVVAGSSRVLLDVSPAAMSRYLPGLHVANFGFNGTGFSAAYLRAIDGPLDPSSRTRAIILGIQSSELTPRNTERNLFLELSGEKRLVLQSEVRFAHLVDALRPYEPRELARALLGRKTKEGLIWNRHLDGWAAARFASSVQEREARDEGVRHAMAVMGGATDGRYRVSEEVVANLLAAVRRWTAMDIQVYGFCPPGQEGLINLAARRSGFDERAFAERFERAGGTWLTVPAAGCQTYDGIHLPGDAAVRFSEKLGEVLAPHLAVGLSDRLSAGRRGSRSR
jgi:hypothetical protein